MMKEPGSRFIAGLIGPPFGLKGFVKVRPFSGDIAHLLTLQSVTMRRGEAERLLRIEESAAAPPAALLKFAGISSPEEAKALGGAELLVDREHASPLLDGEFYVEDLRGLEVVAVDDSEGGSAGEVLGYVTDIIEGGGGDLAEVRLLNGKLKFVPFRKEFFADISPEKGRLALLHRWILE